MNPTVFQELRELAMESALGTVCKQYAGQQNAPAVPLLAHVQGCLLSLVAIAGIDLFLRYATLKEYKTHSKARWFMLHSLVNFLVVGFSFHDTIMVLKAPICSMLTPLQSWVPSYLAYSLHLYHFIAYTVVRMEDIVHHLLFVGTFGFVNFLMSWGSIVNLLLLFMTGVPGGIDYAMLSLVKIDKFSRLEEKRLNSHINVWLRMPGLVVVSAIMYSCFIMGQTRVHWFAAILCIILTFLNGVYYMQQVVRNYENEKSKNVPE